MKFVAYLVQLYFEAIWLSPGKIQNLVESHLREVEVVATAD